MTSQPDISEAPTQLMRPGERSGDSGMNTNVHAVAAKERNSGIQKSQW